jgi:thiamine pyrophosphokinase
MIVDFDNYRSILCLNGKLSNWFFCKIHLSVIIADGAADTLSSKCIAPDMIIGDLDIMRRDLLIGRKFIKNGNHNSFDFEKALCI